MYTPHLLFTFCFLKDLAKSGSFLVSVKLKVMTNLFLYVVFLSKIYVGPYQNPRRRQRNHQALHIAVDCTTQNIEEDSGVQFLAPVDVDQLLVGHYVAVNTEEWSNRPLIGQVEKIVQPVVTIRWLDGSYNGTFRDSYVGSGANRKPWTQEVDKSQIVMIGVQFSSSRRIRREHIQELKARYSILDNESGTV